MGAKRLGGKRLGGKRLGGETTRGRNGLGRNVPDSGETPLKMHSPLLNWGCYFVRLFLFHLICVVWLYLTFDFTLICFVFSGFFFWHFFLLIIDLFV